MKMVSLRDVARLWPVSKSNVGFNLELQDKIGIASWISVAILPLCIFLLISYAVLPVKWTHRHYLSICFTLGICCMEVSATCAVCH
jgi:hypothetical protein